MTTRRRRWPIVAAVVGLLPVVYVLSYLCLGAAEYKGWVEVQSRVWFHELYYPIRWASDLFPWFDGLLVRAHDMLVGH